MWVNIRTFIVTLQRRYIGSSLNWTVLGQTSGPSRLILLDRPLSYNWLFALTRDRQLSSMTIHFGPRAFTFTGLSTLRTVHFGSLRTSLEIYYYHCKTHTRSFYSQEFFLFEGSESDFVTSLFELGDFLELVWFKIVVTLNSHANRKPILK